MILRQKLRKLSLDRWLRLLLVVAATMVLVETNYFWNEVSLSASTTTSRMEQERFSWKTKHPPLTPTTRRTIRSSRNKSTTLSFRPYFEIASQVLAQAQKNPFPSNTSHSRVKELVDQPNHWFTPQQITRETCTARQVLYSMDHEERQLLNTLDGLDLSDILLRNRPGPAHLTFHGVSFHPDLLPCIQPGTIFHLNNKYYILDYFWNHVRPNLSVPFVLITSDSDRDSPMDYQGQDFGAYMKNDTLLLRWYGTNPKAQTDHSKFEPMFLGLSKKYPQAKYLEKFLAINDFRNPFDNSQFPTKNDIVLNRDVFVNFGTRRGDRLTLHRDLCQGRANIPQGIYLSCNKTARVTPHDIYQQVSRFRFGVSPPGLGWDCFRTYELLYLGIIPIIERREDKDTGQSVTMFDDLPIIQVHREKRKKAMARNDEIVAAIQNFLSRPPPRNTKAPGWDKLFLAYWRRKVLRDTGKETVYYNGKEYYMGWKYELTDPSSSLINSQGGVYCNHGNGCQVEETSND